MTQKTAEMQTLIKKTDDQFSKVNQMHDSVSTHSQNKELQQELPLSTFSVIIAVLIGAAFFISLFSPKSKK